MVNQQQLDNALAQIAELIQNQADSVQGSLDALRADVETRLDFFENEIQQLAQPPPAPAAPAAPAAVPVLFACTINKVAFASLADARAYYQVAADAPFPPNTDVQGFPSLDAARQACNQPFLQAPAAPAPAAIAHALRLATARKFPAAASALTTQGAALMGTLLDRNVAAMASALATPPRPRGNPTAGRNDAADGAADGGRGRGCASPHREPD